MTIVSDDSVSMTGKKHIDTTLDQRALDMPQFRGCLKKDRRLVTITLSGEFDIKLTMMTETVLTFCEPTRLPHNLDNVNYCIEQWHRQTQRKIRQDLPLDTMEETVCDIESSDATQPHNWTDFLPNVSVSATCSEMSPI